MNLVYQQNKNRFNKVSNEINKSISKYRDSRDGSFRFLAHREIEIYGFEGISVSAKVRVKDPRVTIVEGTNGDLFWCFDVSPDNLDFKRFNFRLQNYRYNSTFLIQDIYTREDIIRQSNNIVRKMILEYNDDSIHSLWGIRDEYRRMDPGIRESYIRDLKLSKEIISGYINLIETAKVNVRREDSKCLRAIKDPYKIPIIQMTEFDGALLFNIDWYSMEKYVRSKGWKNHKVTLEEIFFSQYMRQMIDKTILNGNFKNWIKVDLITPYSIN